MKEIKFLKKRKSYTRQILILFLITGGIVHGVEVNNFNTEYSSIGIETGVISKNNYNKVQDINTNNIYDLSNITDNMKIEMFNFQIRSGSLSIRK